MPTPLLEPSVPSYLFNADAIGAGSNGITYATPASASQFTWVVSYSSAPSAVTVILQGSFDAITWFTLDTSTATAGEMRNVSTNAIFVRAIISAKTGGGNTTVQIVAKRYIVTLLGSGGISAGQDLTLSGMIDLAHRAAPTQSAGRVKLYANTLNGKTRFMELPAGGIVPLPVVYGGTLFWENTNLGNGANTDYVSTGEYVLPAGLMAYDGDELLIEMWMTFNAAVSTKTYQINIGHSAFVPASGFTIGQNVVSSSTATSSAGIIVRSMVRRLSSTTGGWISTAQWAAAATTQGIPYTTGTISWNSNNSIRAIVKDSVGNVDAVKINQMRITYLPNQS